MYRHGKYQGKMSDVGKICTIIVCTVIAASIIWGVTKIVACAKDLMDPVTETEYVEVVKEVPVTEYVEKEVIVSQETIQAEIQAMGKLCTSRYYFTHVASFEDETQLKTGDITIPGINFKLPDITVPGTKNSFVYSYDGAITAGIDFEKIKAEKNDMAMSVTIYLPEAEIISSEVDPDSFKLYDERTGIFSSLSVNDVMQSFNDMLRDEQEKAVSKGILANAEDNAMTLIQSFVKNIYGLEMYDVTVRIYSE